MKVKIVLIVVAILAALGGGYILTRKTDTSTTISSVPVSASAPSPQYLHDHPAALADAKQKCNEPPSVPPEPYCTNVQKAEELVEVDDYKKAVGGGATSE